MNVVQIYITDGDEPLPESLQYTTYTVKRCFPDYTYHLFNKTSLREFIKTHYSDDVVYAYDKLKPYSYKCDLGRLCVINIIGGFYFDISLKCNLQLDMPQNIDLLIFRDILKHGGSSWAIQVGLFYSVKNNPILTETINRIVKNCKNEYYGNTPLDPTGPNLFGQVVAEKHTEVKIVYGDFIECTPCHQKKNTAFVINDGEIFAFGKRSSGGDLTSLGAKGVNNYNTFWHNRDVYDKNINM